MARYPVASRALVFLNAGGTMILLTEASEVPVMSRAVIARTHSDAAFAAKVKAAVMTVLVAKARAGLLT